MAEASELLAEAIDIPSLPEIYEKLNRALADSRTTIKNVAKIVGEDPGVASRLLKLVNSPVFGLRTKIGSVSRAVVVVGMQQLRSLVLGTSVTSLFTNIPREFVDMESFWKHSVACALAAKAIAVRRRETSSERFFLAGIVHDIGRLVIYLKAPEKAFEILRRCEAEKALAYKVERWILGYDHADVGCELMRKWKLPEFIAETVGYHHNPVASRSYSREAAVVHLADIIANALGHGTSGERFVPPLNESAWLYLDLSPSCLPGIVEEVDDQVAEVVELIR